MVGNSWPCLNKVKRLFLEKVLVIKHTSLLVWVHLTSASSDLWSLLVLVCYSKAPPTHMERFCSICSDVDFMIRYCSAAPLNWIAWGSAVPSVVFLGLNLPSSRMQLLNCRHQNWMLYPNTETTRLTKYSLPECPSTCLIPAGTITTTSSKPWILASGISSPFSGPRSELAD